MTRIGIGLNIQKQAGGTGEFPRPDIIFLPFEKGGALLCHSTCKGERWIRENFAGDFPAISGEGVGCLADKAKQDDLTVCYYCSSAPPSCE